MKIDAWLSKSMQAAVSGRLYSGYNKAIRTQTPLEPPRQVVKSLIARFNLRGEYL